MNSEVSVIVPCFNYGHYLEEALDSVLSQDFTAYEIILVDDCSTDNTAAISKKYTKRHSQIRYVAHPKNLGLFQSFITGFQNSTSKYIHYLSADDRYLPGFLSKGMQFLQDHPQAKLVCTDLGYFQDHSDTIESKPLLARCEKPIFIPKEEIVEVFRTTNFWVTGTSCIFYRELLEKYGPFIFQLENLSDWFLFHKIALYEGVGYIPETLTSMRVHEQTLTNQVKRNKKRRRATYHHLLNILLQNKDLLHRFLDAHLLDFIFRDLKWKLYMNPKYMCYWRHTT